MLMDNENEEIDLIFVQAYCGQAERERDARRALENWVGNDPERQAYLQRLHASKRLVESSSDLLRKRYPRQASQFQTASAPRWRAAFGASFACLTIIAAVLVNPTLSRQELRTEVGQRARVTLDDGSQLVLNTDTQLTFVNRLRSRETVLVKGEALFDVTHSTLRPFYIQTGDTRVRVVGTEFDIRRLPGGERISVLRGKVEVRADPDIPPVFLTANQEVETVRRQFASVPHMVDSDSLASWSLGRLEFDNTRLANVVTELQRYRRHAIVLADATSADLTLSGVFSADDPDRLLRTLPAVLPVQVRFEADGTAIIAAR